MNEQYDGARALAKLPSPVGFTEGPRVLPLMPAEMQAALDPYMAMIVGYRKSGLSLNHIIGFPLDCGYCCAISGAASTSRPNAT